MREFTILGERCSGTNFLQKAMETNFLVKYKTTRIGWKHFFGHFLPSDDEKENVVFIGVVRDPVAWIDSFFRQPHHVPSVLQSSVVEFMSQPFWSEYDNGVRIAEDRPFDGGQENHWRNIFELRTRKNE